MRKGSSSFLRKRTKKLLIIRRSRCPNRVRLIGKSFCFFFQKEVLSCCRWVSLKAAWYYWSIPAEALDDPDIMAKWVKLAHEAALRSTKSR
jgi:hypothetical protein